MYNYYGDKDKAKLNFVLYHNIILFLLDRTINIVQNLNIILVRIQKSLSVMVCFWAKCFYKPECERERRATARADALSDHYSRTRRSGHVSAPTPGPRQHRSVPPPPLPAASHAANNLSYSEFLQEKITYEPNLMLCNVFVTYILLIFFLKWSTAIILNHWTVMNYWNYSTIWLLAF